MVMKLLKQRISTFFFGMIMVLSSTASISAQESVADMVRNSCKQELVDYCGKVNPGGGRIIACLYAHSDQTNDQCSEALEVGVVQLNMILSAVNNVVDQCHRDLDTFCGDELIGGKRMYQCMSKNRNNLEPECKSAFLQAEEDLKQ